MKDLSKREHEIADLLFWGYTDKEIASKLCRSYETIRTHRKNIYEKTACRNLADLCRYVFDKYYSTQIACRHFTLGSLQKATIAYCFLALIAVAEISQSEFVRRRAKNTKSAQLIKLKSKRRRTRTKDFYLKTA